MKKIKKYGVSFLVIFLLVIISKPILIETGFWYYELADDYYLMGQGNGSYSIKKSYFSSNLVNDIDRHSGWMISNKGIYGYVNNDKRFYLDRNSDTVHYFYDSGSFSKYLKEHNEKSYHLSLEEGLVHFRNDVDRIYKK